MTHTADQPAHTSEHPPGATLHLGGNAWAHPDLNEATTPLDGLTPYPGNPRRGDQDAITASIRDLGLYRAIIVQRSTGHVLAGNHTLRALTDLGATHAPVTYVDVDDTRAAAIVARDNRTSDLGVYDDADLAALLTGLSDADALLLSGYTEEDLTGLIGDPGNPIYDPPTSTPSLSDRFVVPPFTVLDQRSGAWQERKRRWLALGIQSELGRGHDGMGGHMGTGPDGVSLRADPNQYAKREKAKRQKMGGVQTNLDGVDAARYGRKDTRKKVEPRTFTNTDGLARIKPGLKGTLTGERSLGQGLQAHRDPATGELVYTETTAAGVSIFDPVLTELSYRWFSPMGGTVLDPFAGGSVRGIVAAALGRHYVGCELRGEQVAANRDQADRIVPRLPGTAVTAPGDYTPDLTPVETHAGVLVKRDDAWRVGRATGAKSRTMHRLLTTGTYDGILTGGARVSPQIERAALVAEVTGHPCRVHTGAGGDTNETATAAGAGAEVLRHSPARMSVIKARLTDDAAERPTWLHVPFGMGMEEYVDDVAAQTANLPDGRLVVPVGSGATLAGILRGLDAAGDTRPILGVMVGGEPTHLDTYAPGWRDRPGLTLTASDLDYTDHAPNTLGDLTLDPQYEAKCLPHLAPGDVLWLVACRTSAETTPGETTSAPMPVWHTGDSAVTIPTLDVRADLVFSCPPYADLEVYSDDPADISNMPYDDFLTAYRAIIAAACDRLRDDRFAVWVIGEVRDKRGLYRGFVPDTIAAFRDAGLALYNEAVLVTPVGSLPIRAGRQFATGRKLGKTHQTVLTFVKGDPRAAADACGIVEVTMPEVADPDAEE
ncbi:pyridoxal-phosphate dependent enzyme [Pseudanabaena phage Pam4]|nr:pyridoxal-phosphate dependent enzyme [Pseudanabaena phage Pam4]